MNRFWDVVVVGAGPVGLAAAIEARRAGMNVVVLERRRPGIDKACGEGVMPPGVARLDALGVTLPTASSSPFTGIRYIDLDGTTPLVAEGTFPAGEGRGIRRVALSKALEERARQVGVVVRYECAARSVVSHKDHASAQTPNETVRGAHLIAADGLHSAVRRHMGLGTRPTGVKRYGVRRHYALPPWSSKVEVYWHQNAEAYVTPVGNAVGVAILHGCRGARFETLLSSFAPLRERLHGVPAVSEARGAGPFRQRVRRRYRGRVALVGDAAGYVDALTGEGITLGLRSAHALVEVLAEGAPLEDYEIRYRRLSRTYYTLTETLLQVARRPRWRRRVMHLLVQRPALFDQVLGLTAGDETAAMLGWRNLSDWVNAARRPSSAPPQ